MDIHAEYQLALNSTARYPVLAIGPAGTGKTYGALAAAVKQLEARSIQHIVYLRVPEEVGPSIGFLPGEMEEKMMPWVAPARDALSAIEGVTPAKLDGWMRNGKLIAMPIGFIQGRTFDNSFIIIDEAQNTTYKQLKLACTRVGKYSRLVVTGCLGQEADEHLASDNGLLQLDNALSSIENNWETFHFTNSHVMRSDSCADLNDLFDKWERIRKHEGF